MPDTHASRVLLIDLDNCPRELENLHETLMGFTRVVACHGTVEPKVSLGLVPLLAAALSDGKLELVGMKRSGKNAADFGLAFCAGRLVAETPPGTDFCIVSKDSDLDHVVDMLHSVGRTARRLDGPRAGANGGSHPARASVLADGVAKPNEIELRALEYQACVLRPDLTRPSKRAKLLNSVRAYFKDRGGVVVEEIVRTLEARRVLSIGSNNDVTYPDDLHDIPL